MCFFFKFGTATNVWFDGLCGKPPSRGCAIQLSSVKKAGGRQAAIPRGRPPLARNDRDPPHTAEGPPHTRQAAAYPIRCSFWFPQFHTRRSQKRLNESCVLRKMHDVWEGISLDQWFPPYRTFLHHPHQPHPSFHRSEVRSYLWKLIHQKSTIGLT